jgi:hypothetical protein
MKTSGFSWSKQDSEADLVVAILKKKFLQLSQVHGKVIGYHYQIIGAKRQ